MAISNLLTSRWESLLSGKLKPWELPEYQGIESRLQKIGALNRQGMGRQLTAAGVRGPALGMALEKARETEMAPMGRAITSAYQQIPSQAMSWQQHLDALAEGEKNRQLGLMSTWAQKHAATVGSRRAQQAQSIPCILATACYGVDSTAVDLMRVYRDIVLPEKIIRGYYVFSDVILPLMKFRIVKRFVKAFIVDSLIGAGLRCFGERFHWRHPFDIPVAIGFLSFWKILGSRGVYRRKNGELV